MNGVTEMAVYVVRKCPSTVVLGGFKDVQDLVLDGSRVFRTLEGAVGFLGAEAEGRYEMKMERPDGAIFADSAGTIFLVQELQLGS